MAPPHTDAGRSLDHLVYATPSLERTLDDLERALGVRPLTGGSHPGWGTRNAILPLGPSSYLEIIGPDPEQPGHRPSIFQLSGLSGARLVTWAAKGRELGALVAAGLTHGLHLGRPMQGNRQRPDGTILRWEMTDPQVVVEEGLVPFFIDWGTSPHPGASAAALVALSDFHAEHPEPGVLRTGLAVLGLELPIVEGPRRRLVATLESPEGLVTLR